jgi:hypothetical protein
MNMILLHEVIFRVWPFRLLALLTLLFVVGASIAPAQARRVALVIGNGAYEHTMPLRNPANDADDIAAALKRLDFEVITSINARGGTLADVLGRFIDSTRNAEVALLFYAGHGVQFDGRNYIVPIDGKLTNEFAFKREAIAIDDIVSPMEANAKISLIFLDACRNNPLADQLQRSVAGKNRDSVVGRGLARMDVRSKNTLLVYATSPGRVAEDGAGRNSPFVEALLRHIETPGQDVEVVMKDVTSDVRRGTADRQQPERLSRLETRFSFRPQGTQQAPQKEPVSRREIDKDDRLYWESVRSSEDPTLMQSYVTRFPNGMFVDLARARIRQLSGKGVPAASPERDRDKAFNEAIDAGTSAALERFVQTYPDDPRAPRLREAIREQRLWDEAQRAADMAGYRKYLLAFPNGTYATGAKRRIEELTAPIVSASRSPGPKSEPTYQPPAVVAPWCSETRAFAVDEIAICRSSELSRLDGELTWHYTRVRGQIDPDSVRQLNLEQRVWRQQRISCGSDTGCLTSAYRSRLGELQAR